MARANQLVHYAVLEACQAVVKQRDSGGRDGKAAGKTRVSRPVVADGTFRSPFYTKAEGAYLSLRTQVIQGLIPPGSSLDQEELASSFGVSTTPLREAIRRLEGEGLLQVTAHKEVIVAHMSPKELFALYETRLALDPCAVRLAAERASAEQRDLMRELAGDEGELTPLAQLQANRQIHRAIYSACDNTILVETLENLWDRCDRYRYTLIDQAPNVVQQDAHAAHVQLVEAVVERRGPDAEQLMRDHLLGSIAWLGEMDFDAPPWSE